MLGPIARKINYLRERLSDLSSVHATLGGDSEIHVEGWAHCPCSLSAQLRDISQEIEKLIERKSRKAKR